MADKFGIAESMVFPVQNYSRELEKKMGIDILTLRTLRQILRNSEAFLEELKYKDGEKIKQAQKMFNKMTLGSL